MLLSILQCCCHLVCKMIRHLRDSRWKIDFFTGELDNFSKMIDGKVKRISSTGAGAKRGKTEVITPEEEEKLWIIATLGDHSPKSLLNTISTCVEFISHNKVVKSTAN